MGILKFKKPIGNSAYFTVSVLGRSLKLNIKYGNILTVSLTKTDTEINLILPKKYKNKDNMEIINLSIQKLYDKIAFEEIEYSMEIARHILKFAPEDYYLKRIENDFYKCCKKQIVINPDIVKFSRDIINTTILQAFCKIKYRPNSIKYNMLLQYAMEKYELYKKKTNIDFKISKVS